MTHNFAHRLFCLFFIFNKACLNYKQGVKRNITSLFIYLFIYLFKYFQHSVGLPRDPGHENMIHL